MKVLKKKKIIILLCSLAAAYFLGGCAASASGEHPPETAAPAALQAEVPAAEQTEPAAVPVAAPPEQEDGLHAAELFRIRFTAVQPAAAEQAEEIFSEVTDQYVSLVKDAIPAELVSALCRAVDDGTSEEFISSHRTGTELTLDEMLTVTGTDAFAAPDAMSFRADIDNDGTEDIISHIWGGGTGGFASIVLFSGSDGFRQTESVPDIYYKTSVLRWDGKNYLCVDNFNYLTKQWLGYTVYAFSGGKVAAVTDICKTITGYTSEVIVSDLSYPGIGQIEATLNNSRIPSVLDSNGVIYGTAETVNEDLGAFSADINNDGITEYYTKYMFFPSTAGMQQHCIWSIDGLNDANDPVTLLTNRAENRDAGLLYTFWLDKVNSDNILYLYFSGDFGYELCAYRLSA